jgi:hypothetical protein
MTGTSPADGLVPWLVIYLATTVWVGIDNRSLRRRGITDKPTWLWVVECLALWIVFFPWHLVNRHRSIGRYRSMLSSLPPPPRLPPPPPT